MDWGYLHSKCEVLSILYLQRFRYFFCCPSRSKSKTTILFGLLSRDWVFLFLRNIKPSSCLLLNKNPPPPSAERDIYRGSEQIRTAVRGFADLCLATRPRNLFRPVLQECESCCVHFRLGLRAAMIVIFRYIIKRKAAIVMQPSSLSNRFIYCTITFNSSLVLLPVRIRMM